MSLLSWTNKTYCADCSITGKAQTEILSNVVAMYLDELPEFSDASVASVELMASLDFVSAHICTTLRTTLDTAVNDITEALLRKCHELPSANLPRHDPKDSSFGTFRIRLKVIDCIYRN